MIDGVAEENDEMEAFREINEIEEVENIKILATS